MSLSSSISLLSTKRPHFQSKVWIYCCMINKLCHLMVSFSLNIFYFQQITSYTVQYIQFIRKLGLERKRKLIEFFSYYRQHCDMEGGLYHVPYQFVVNMITHWPVKQVWFLCPYIRNGKWLNILHVLCELVNWWKYWDKKKLIREDRIIWMWVWHLEIKHISIASESPWL